MKKHLALFLVVVMAVSIVSTAGVASAARGDKPLAKPHILTPKNDAQETRGCTLEWKPVTGAGGYYLEMKSTTDGITWVDEAPWSGTTTSVLWTPYEGDEGTTYTWHVKARVTDGVDSPLDSAWSPWRTFTFIGSTPPPLAVSVTTNDGSYSGVVASGKTFYSSDTIDRQFTFTATEAGSWCVVDISKPVGEDKSWSTGTSVSVTMPAARLQPLSVHFFKQSSDTSDLSTADWHATFHPDSAFSVSAWASDWSYYGKIADGASLSIARGQSVTFGATESGTWCITDPNADSTLYPDHKIWSTGSSVTIDVPLGRLPLYGVEFFKQGSDLSTADWHATVYPI